LAAGLSVHRTRREVIQLFTFLLPAHPNDQAKRATGLPAVLRNVWSSFNLPFLRSHHKHADRLNQLNFMKIRTWVLKEQVLAYTPGQAIAQQAEAFKTN